MHTELKVMKRHVIVIFMAVIITIYACGCTSVPVNQSAVGGPPETTTFNLTLSSNAFSPGGTIPDMYSCKGQNISPPLSWQNVPVGSKSLAMIVVDTDAPLSGGYVHWIVYNIPVNSTGIPADQPRVAVLPNGSGQGLNTAGGVGYTGPCPPQGSPHHYHFRLYALDTSLDLQGSVNRSVLEGALQGHILQSTELVGLFTR